MEAMHRYTTGLDAAFQSAVLRAGSIEPPATPGVEPPATPQLEPPTTPQIEPPTTPQMTLGAAA